MARLLSAAVLVCVVGGFTRADNKSGEVKFIAVNKEAAKVSGGDKVKYTVALKLIDIGGGSHIQPLGTVKNTANVKMHYSFQVAFLDKDKNLVVCHSFTLFLDPGAQGTLGVPIAVPKAEIGRIEYYSIAFHEGEKSIGN